MRLAPVATLALVLGGCERAESPRTAPTAPSSSAPALAAMPPPRAPLTPARGLGCRALTVTGGVRLDGQPVAVGALVDGRRWLELDDGATVSLRHTESARELAVRGPARALACPNGEEEVVLGQGRLSTAAGPGARPGAQVVVHTPLGTVSYGDARANIQASRSEVTVGVEQGQAWVLPADGARRVGPEEVGPRGKATLRGAGEAAKLVSACEARARTAEQWANQVLSPDGGGPDAGSLGERAAAHMGARQAARRACGSARAALSATEDAARRGFEQRLERAERSWQALGGGPKAAPSPSAG